MKKLIIIAIAAAALAGCSTGAVAAELAGFKRVFA